MNSLALNGQTATFTFVVANDSEHEAVVEITANTIRDYIADGEDSELDSDGVFIISTSWDDNEKKATLPAATDPSTPGTTELEVTVTLNGNPTNVITGYFDITLVATTVD